MHEIVKLGHWNH